MKSLKFLLVFLFLFPITVWAQQEQSVLWKISGKGLKKHSYLFGTNHVAPYQELQQFPKILKIIKNTDKGLFETTPSSPIKLDSTLEKKMNPPLDEIFTREEYEIVDDFFSKTMYGSIKPHNHNADLLAMLYVVMTMKDNPKAAENMTFDYWIMKFMSEDLKKEIFPLDDLNLAYLHLSELTTPRGMAVAMVNLIQDIGLTGKYLETEIASYILTLKADLKLKEVSLDKRMSERNQLWLPKIEEQIKSGSCFIAVGAGHLKYEIGLIQLLRKEGYKLTPVKLKRKEN
ncbi:lipoprotein [Adhaeribacter aerolatus]|uniref:Lipoprotein n=1 Tax=Adhaeribacter aerolatus TaxID=670289 RepID=A0A512ATI0_9BACT|nr:TraB/GumN family protein [Adhaeribacter aerolatus]GEO02993.1 lipoprotein [Adhaeribacter aerolatus]